MQFVIYLFSVVTIVGSSTIFVQSMDKLGEINNARLTRTETVLVLK